VGPELEHALGKSIEKLSKRAKILQLSRTKDLTLLPLAMQPMAPLILMFGSIRKTP